MSAERKTAQTRFSATLPLVLLLAGVPGSTLGVPVQQNPNPVKALEQQVTRGRGGRILTNVGVWSPDSLWVVYDTRSDPAGEFFDGSTIELINIRTGEQKTLCQSAHGAHCGVATFHPHQPKVVFILGPEHPSADWQYNAFHRRGVVVDVARPGAISGLDARDLTPPFTPGALRGGSHVHVWDGAGEWVSFTYEDHLLAQFKEPAADHDVNQRNLGVCVPHHPVRVSRAHPRNHDGQYFSVVVTRTAGRPTPGSDEIQHACEESWVGTNGYVRLDHSRQRHALAFQGQVVTQKGEAISEVYIVDLPEDLTVPGAGPLEGTAQRLPYPPKGTTQRRLTYTAARKFPGLQGPRHWLRSSPEGSRIAFLMKDEDGVVQLWTISPNGGQPRQLTHNPQAIASAFTWSPDGRFLAHAMDNSICLTDADTGHTSRLTPRSEIATAPRPEACVFSPDGTKIAFIRRLPEGDQWSNQICVLHLQP